jgi:hypothetical protein
MITRTKSTQRVAGYRGGGGMWRVSSADDSETVAQHSEIPMRRTSVFISVWPIKRTSSPGVENSQRNL